MSGDLSGRKFEFHSIGKALVSDDDLERGSHQVRIVEFHARSFVPIIPEYFEPGCLQFVIEPGGNLGGLC